jgi:hypothetical protein
MGDTPVNRIPSPAPGEAAVLACFELADAAATSSAMWRGASGGASCYSNCRDCPI